MGHVLAGFRQISRGPGPPPHYGALSQREEGAVFICALALDFEKDFIVCKDAARSGFTEAEASESGLCVRFFEFNPGSSLRLVEQHNDCCSRGVLTQMLL